MTLNKNNKTMDTLNLFEDDRDYSLGLVCSYRSCSSSPSKSFCAYEFICPSDDSSVFSSSVSSIFFSIPIVSFSPFCSF